MERRELLKIMAMTLGGSVALPESVFAKMGEPFDPMELTFFSVGQRAQVAVLAEAIIPKTDTPGAIEAGVPGWIEVIVRDCFEEKDQQVITEGLAAIMMRCVKECGVGLGELAAEKQVEFLTRYDGETREARWRLEGEGKVQRVPFLEQFKELTKFCYASSEVGATQAFDFFLVPGQWIPDKPLVAGMKAYALP